MRKNFPDFTPYEKFRFVGSAFVVAAGLACLGVTFLALSPIAPRPGTQPVIGSALVLVGFIWGWRDKTTRPSFRMPDA